MKIGNFIPDNKVFLAPMAGVNDKSFRTICKEHGCGLVYTEMVSSKGLYYGSKKTEIMLDIDDREGRAAVQIFGSVPEIMGAMAEEISKNEKVAFIDINMGCPAPKITKNGEGSALMKTPVLAEKIIKSAVLKSHKPVTVKIRKGWDDHTVNAVEYAKMIEASGAAAVAIHGRTREQMYEGKADWDIIKKVKESVKIPVIGNGDVVDFKSAEALLNYTGCDAIMIGRGALGNPWVFDNVTAYLEDGRIVTEPSPAEKIDEAYRHLCMVIEDKGSKGLYEMRKQLSWYMKGLKDSSRIRDMINHTDKFEDVRDILFSYKEELNNSFEE